MVEPLYGVRLYRAMRDAPMPVSATVVPQRQPAVHVQISSDGRRLAEEKRNEEPVRGEGETDMPLYFNHPRAKGRQG
jgi:hypothetical protein